MSSSNNPLKSIVDQIESHLNELGVSVASAVHQIEASAPHRRESVSAIQGNWGGTAAQLTRHLAGQQSSQVLIPGSQAVIPGSQAVRPGYSPYGASQAVRTPSTGESVSGIRGWMAEQRKASRELQDLMTPVGQKTSGMSFAERKARLEKSGGLLSAAEVASRRLLGGKRQPTAQDIVTESETVEEQNRQKKVGQMGKGAAAGGLFDMLKGKAAGLAKAHPYAAVVIGGISVLMVAIKAMSTFSRNVVESSRQLAIFHPTIAASVIQLDRQTFIHRVQLAEATAGSASTASSAVRWMNEELRPIKEAMTTTKNVLAATAAVAVATTLRLFTIHIKFMKVLADASEWFMKKADKDGPGNAYVQFLSDITNGNFRNHRRPPGGAP